MKIIYSIVFIILFPFLLSAQELMTIGQVFDFDVNDEFHFEYRGDNIPPNANRIKIIGKYYSTDEDTLYYVRFHDSYHTVFIGGSDPHLEYHFSTTTDTISISNLDLSISSYSLWIQYDTSMYSYDTTIETSDEYCDILVNNFSLSTNDFEPEYYSRTFGEGLGLVRNYYDYPSENSGYERVLFYYKKDNFECGTADMTTVFLVENNKLNDINIFPNPAQSFIRVESNNHSGIESILLTDLNGCLIRNYKERETILDISEIPTGIYFLNISYKSGQIVKKVFIE